MRKLASLLVAGLLLAPGASMGFGGLSAATQQSSTTCETIGTPLQGVLYHGVYPGGITGEEDDIAPGNVSSYEQLAGKSVAWVYFSDNWYKGRSFPIQTATWIRSMGSIPFIRLMLRSSNQQNVSEPTFTLDRIINGTFDADLRAWARGAKNFSSPLLVEYGTEVNGMWFPWNGFWNGGGTLNGTQPLGPEKFRDAYRHIVQVMRSVSACNITWVFHVNNQDVPSESWNQLENYYPGDEWVDWIGVSAYGVMSPTDNDTHQLRELMDNVYPRLASLNATKPIVLLEFGASSGNPQIEQATWARYALANLTTLRWPRLIGFSWWNEAWANDNNPAHNSDMRLQDSPALASVFMNYVGSRSNVLGTPVIVGPSVVTTTTTTTSSTTTSSTTSTSTTTTTSTSTTSSSSSTTSSTSSSTSSRMSTTTPSTTSSSSASSSTSQTTTSSTSSSSTPFPTSTTAATTSSTAPTTQQAMTTASTTGSGGIPEFPYQMVVATVFTALVVVSYLLVRRHPRMSRLRF